MKSKKSYNKILVLFCIIVVSVLMTGCDNLPIVLNFSASPSTVNQGDSSALSWSVSKADTVTITSIGTVDSSGSTTVSPGVTTTYILIATNSTGGVTATATVNVQAISLLPVHNITKDTYYNTIQIALNDADSGNTIEVANGSYDETIYFPSGKKVILQSVNGPSSTTIRGDDNASTVNLDNSLPGTTIEGFTITHAVGLIGRGILNDAGSHLTIDNCVVSNNNGCPSGGGMRNDGTLIITGTSIISGNTANGAGGILNWDTGTLTITGESTVSGNSAGIDGGGIYNYGGTLTITGASTVSGNSAAAGGGIFNEGGTLTITGESTVSGNTANWGGGGIENVGTLTITGESTISDNIAYQGGGIYNDGTLIITGTSIISGNSADWGGGIFIGGLPTTITASIIYSNSADSNGGGIYIEVGSSIPTIGGSSSAEKNTICGNYKSGNSPSLDQQIRDNSGDLCGSYMETNYIYINCPF